MRLSIWLFGLVLFSPCINCGMCICYIYVWLFSISFKSRKIETEWHDTTAHTYGRAHKPCGTQKIVLRLSHLMCYKHRPKYVYICIYAIFIAKYWNVNITKKKKKNKKVENHGTDQAEWGYIITTSQIQVCKALLCVCGMCSFRIWISICNVILYFFFGDDDDFTIETECRWWYCGHAENNIYWICAQLRKLVWIPYTQLLTDFKRSYFFHLGSEQQQLIFIFGDEGLLDSSFCRFQSCLRNFRKYFFFHFLPHFILHAKVL